ncbi:TPA: sodium-translocating pyrophosphatase [bacterium]|nr:sodium-translocating pyrophosphatase [bacterium]
MCGEDVILLVILGSGFLGLLYAGYLAGTILKEDQGTDDMKKVAFAIQEGANAYLKRQFTTIAWFIIVLTIVLLFTSPPSEAQHVTGEKEGFDWFIAIGRSLAFLLGAVFSALVGGIGMSIAVRGNVRTTQAARSSFRNALKISFRTGSVTGMICVGLGIIGATIIYMIYKERCYEVLVGFGFGGCLLALFMRVGGGIYTKAADVGADLVGKVEKGIPEDDPRNAATIADNVGDNVGDCAGMAADIFESYEVTLVAAMILGTIALPPEKYGPVGVIFPLIVRAIGVLTSIIGTYLVQAKSEEEDAMRPIQRSFVISAILTIIGTFIVSKLYMPNGDMRFGWAVCFGLVLAICISYLTEYFTSYKEKPVQEIARSTQTGPATTILSGLSVGLESSVWSIFLIAIAIISSMMLFGGDVNLALYGISLCGMGMLATTGLIVSMDSYGPVTDNAHGIGEMTGVGHEGKTEEITNRLDAVGNTTKATTKGFAIATAAIAAISLFSSYIESSGLFKTGIRINTPLVFVGFLFGGGIPFLFSSLLVRAVGRAAGKMVEEVRRQFREIPGIMEGTARPEYAKCIDIATSAAQKELIGPGLLAVLAPIIVGFMFGAEALGGYLVGIIISGQLLAVFMANGGGAWDNAKKFIEAGNYGGKGGDCHKASVIGDTVGDPLKDTSGPALNPLIKVMNLIALLIAGLIMKYGLVSDGAFVLRGITLVVVVLATIIVGIAIINSKKEAFGGK